MTNWLLVAFGGAIGAGARYGVNQWIVQVASANHWLKAFPFGTLIVNISGSLLLACLFVVTQHHAQQQSLWLLLGVGVLGAFTTFSTFSLEFVQLAQQGDYLKAILFASANFIGCIGAILLVLWLKSFILAIWN
jgi:CrcB protein